MIRTPVLLAIVFLAFVSTTPAGEDAGACTGKELEKLYVEALSKESLYDYRRLFHPASVQAALDEPSSHFDNYFEFHFRKQVSVFSRLSYSWRKALSKERFHLQPLPDNTGSRANSLRFRHTPTHLLTFSNIDGRGILIVLKEYVVFEKRRWMFVTPLPPAKEAERPGKESRR